VEGGVVAAVSVREGGIGLGYVVCEVGVCDSRVSY